MRFLGSKYANNAFAGPTGGSLHRSPDPLAGKGEGPPGWAPGRWDPREGQGRKRKGGGGGKGKLFPPDVIFYG